MMNPTGQVDNFDDSVVNDILARCMARGILNVGSARSVPHEADIGSIAGVDDLDPTALDSLLSQCLPSKPAEADRSTAAVLFKVVERRQEVYENSVAIIADSMADRLKRLRFATSQPLVENAPHFPAHDIQGLEKYEEEQRDSLERQSREMYKYQLELGWEGDYCAFNAMVEAMNPFQSNSLPKPLTNATRQESQVLVTVKTQERSELQGGQTKRSSIMGKINIANLPAAPYRRKPDIATCLATSNRVVLALPKDGDAFVIATLSNKEASFTQGKETVSADDLRRLRPNCWINDEIINFYGRLIADRAAAGAVNKENHGRERSSDTLPSVFYFNTFFWPKLVVASGNDPGAKDVWLQLDRWTKKVDLFSYDLVIFAMNHRNIHWSTAAINFRDRQIELYDSMFTFTGLQRAAEKTMLSYIAREYRRSHDGEFDFSGWVVQGRSSLDFPQQDNTTDCGVFTLQALECISRRSDVNSFSQMNIPFIRRRIVWEIGHGHLLS